MNNKGRNRIYNSPKYKSWQNEVGKIIQSKRMPGIAGPYHLAIKAAQKRNKDGSISKKHCDLGNLEKPISDALQKFGVIEDDKLCQTIFICWADTTDGCWIEVSEARVAV